MAARAGIDFDASRIAVPLTRRAAKWIAADEWPVIACVKHEYSAATVGRRRHAAELTVWRHVRTGAAIVSGRLEQPTLDGFLRAAGEEVPAGENVVGAVERVAAELGLAAPLVERVLAQLAGK
jgi:hypothetical protein